MQAIIGLTLLSSKAAPPSEKPFEIYDTRLAGFTRTTSSRSTRSFE
jgi:hypothetical protein